MTPFFKNIDSTKKISLRDIKVLNEAGAEFDTSKMSTQLGAGKVTIKKLSAKGAFLDTYTFIWTKSKQGWYNGTGSTPVTEANDVVFENGEGMLVTSLWQWTDPKDSKVKVDTNVFFQVSGEVALSAQNSFPFGKSIAGNSLPRKIDLTEIKVLNENCEEFDPSSMGTQLGAGKVTIKKLSPGGAFLDTYTFIWTKSKKGWYNGTGSTAVKVGDFPFEIGESFLLTNGWKAEKTDERIIFLQMPNPLDPMPVPAE